MPAIGKVLHAGPDARAEFLATAESTGGAFVSLRVLNRPGLAPVEPHLHLVQQETFEVVSGRLSYRLGTPAGFGDPPVAVASAGEKVVTPAGIPHMHWNAEPAEDLVVIQTLSPALDADFFFESAYGIASEGRATGARLALQAAVWLRSLEGPIATASSPVWLQRAGARVVAPVARLMGYRSVYRRFSGEER